MYIFCLDVAGRNWFRTTFSKMKNTFDLVLAARFGHGYISQKHFFHLETVVLSKTRWHKWKAFFHLETCFTGEFKKPMFHKVTVNSGTRLILCTATDVFSYVSSKFIIRIKFNSSFYVKLCRIVAVNTIGRHGGCVKHGRELDGGFEIYRKSWKMFSEYVHSITETLKFAQGWATITIRMGYILNTPTILPTTILYVFLDLYKPMDNRFSCSAYRCKDLVLVKSEQGVCYEQTSKFAACPQGFLLP